MSFEMLSESEAARSGVCLCRDDSLKAERLAELAFRKSRLEEKSDNVVYAGTGLLSRRMFRG
jgi:hypothetical protein